MFIDVHAHLYNEKFSNLQDVIKRANENNVKKIICCGSNIEDSKKCLEIANLYDNVFACVGVHPEDAGCYDDKIEQELVNLANNEKVVGIGEIGLDYYASTVSKEKQKDVFMRQILIAKKINKPIIIHCREATGDMMELAKAFCKDLECKVIMHCFNKNKTVAKFFLDLGFYFSIGGCCTFENSEKLQESIKFLPLERILLETDCPYMSPVPLRGQINEPKNVVYVAEKISKIKNISLNKVEEATTNNALKIFKI